MIARALKALGLLPVPFLVACDPCAGVAHCAPGSALVVAGQIVDAATGAGIDGVRIDVVRTGGIAVDRDSTATLTQGGGQWRVALVPASAGTLIADIQVSPPADVPYRLRGVALEARQSAGDLNLNERWVTRLTFDYLGEFFRTGTDDERIQGAQVEFRRTGGVLLYGPGAADSVYRDTTYFGGRVSLFPSAGPRAIYARESGTLRGDVTVRLPDGTGTTVLRGLELVPNHRYRDPRDGPPIIRAAVGSASATSPAPPLGTLP